MMEFTRRPHITWGPQPSRRWRENWCGLCRCPAGTFFDVPDDVWLFYVGEEQSRQILCICCWRWLTDVTDGSAYERRNGGPVALWSPEFRRRHGVSPDEPSAIRMAWVEADAAEIATARAHRPGMAQQRLRRRSS